MGCREYLRNNTQSEKILLIAVAILSFVVVVLFIGLMSKVHGDEVCNNPECVRAASLILDSVDASVDPCDDFYNFTCGTFLKNAYAKGQPSWIHQLEELKTNKLKEIVIETIERNNVSRALAMQRKFYRACINETAIEEDNDRTLLSLLDEFIGGWPVVKSYWVESDFDIGKTMIKARQMGFFYQFYFRVETFIDEKKYILIKPPREADIASLHWRKYNRETIHAIAKDLGARSQSAITDLIRAMEFTEQLEKLAKMYGNETTEPDINKNITIKDINHKYIKMDWLDFLSSLTGVQLEEDDLVVFDVDDYFRDLYYLLLKTSKKIQANYMGWAVISTNVNFMTKKIRDKYEVLKKSANTTYQKESRSDLCYTLSTDLFKYVAEGEYIRRHTPPSTRTYVRDMIKNIKNERNIFAQKYHWSDGLIKNISSVQSQIITEAVGWTDLVYDAKKFEKLFDYHQLHINSTKLVEMARQARIIGITRYYKDLKRTVRELVLVNVNAPKLETNAFFMRFFNKIILPTPILEEPIFEEKRPHYMNYGALGSIIGYELVHSITNYSVSDDSNTSDYLKNINSDTERFIQCLIDQIGEGSEYVSAFKDTDNTDIFGQLADFVGVDLAYVGYKQWVTENFYEDLLPGIKYTPNQLFWIMTSSFLCHEPRLKDKDKIKKQESTQAAMSYYYRALGRLRNSPYFAQDFNCPVGSRMNPEKKCRIYG